MKERDRKKEEEKTDKVIYEELIPLCEVETNGPVNDLCYDGGRLLIGSKNGEIHCYMASSENPGNVKYGKSNSKDLREMSWKNTRTYKQVSRKVLLFY